MDELGDQLLQIALSVLILSAPIIIAVFARALRVYILRINRKLEIELEANQYELLQQVAFSLVAASEQLYEANSKKFTEAATALCDFADKNGIDLTQAESTLLIESMVNAFKLGIGDD